MTVIHASPASAASSMRAQRSRTQPAVQTLDIAYTPDSDDAFNFYAWEHGRIVLDGFAPKFHRAHICMLNHAAAAGLHDVVAVSSVMYPALADRYAILATGNSVGRGYGPVLASKRFGACEELRSRRIGVADVSTTGGALALMYCRDATLVAMPYDRIADAVVTGEVDAGVMIHEELLHFPQKGLRRVCDLGQAWCDDTGLPLPVGLNLVRRSLGAAHMRAICRACRDSLRWAHAHFDEALAFASNFGRGCARTHIAMFSNADTDTLPDDVRRAIEVMCRRVRDIGLASADADLPGPGELEVIDA